MGKKVRSMTNLWLDIVREYVSLKLSYESDRLPTLSGLASRLAEQFGATYLAGLWKEDLPRQLLWDADADIRPQYASETRALGHCAPTWSWASLTAPHIAYETVDGAFRVTPASIS